MRTTGDRQKLSEAVDGPQNRGLKNVDLHGLFLQCRTVLRRKPFLHRGLYQDGVTR